MPHAKQLERIERLCGRAVRADLEAIRGCHPAECRRLAGIVEHFASVFWLVQAERQAEKLNVTISPLPWFAAVSKKTMGRCVECGLPIVGRRKKALYCSDSCAARTRARGRDRVGNGKSSAENAVRRLHGRAERHRASCAACSAGEYCPKAMAMWDVLGAPTDALSRRRGSLPPDAEEPLPVRRSRAR